MKALLGRPWIWICAALAIGAFALGTGYSRKSEPGQAKSQESTDSRQKKSDFADFKFPRLLEALYEGRANDVPDDQQTRSMVVSIWKSFNERCGESSIDVGLAAMNYASPQVRRMRRDLAGSIGQALMDFAKMRDQALATGDFAGSMRDYAQKNAILTQEGVDDGRMLISRFGCGSKTQLEVNDNIGRIILARSGSEPSPPDHLRFYALMSPDFRTKNNIPDPAVEMARRKIAGLQKGARQSCSQSFDSKKFCSCVIDKLADAKLTEADWSAMSNDFHKVTDVGRPQAIAIDAVRACYD
jgi:hypothetical protein